MSSFQRLAVAAMTAALLFLAKDARAERACEADPLITGRACPVEMCIALQDQVTRRCKAPAPYACKNVSGCEALLRERQHWLDCYIARTTINMKCWNGGDLGHQQGAATAIEHVGKCDERIALPRPEGCGNSCF